MAIENNTPSLSTNQQKHCNNCGIDGLREESFHKDSGSPDGYSYQCKVCTIQRAANYYAKNKTDVLEKERQKRIAKAIRMAQEKSNILNALIECVDCHAEKALKEFRKGWNWPPIFHQSCSQCRIRVKNAAWVGRQTPEQKARTNAQRREQRQTNLEFHRQQERASRSGTKDRRNQLERARRKQNPDQYTGYKSARRARKKALPVFWNVFLAQFARQYWENSCAICGREEGLWYTIAMDHFIPLMDQERCPGTVPWNMLPVCNSKKGVPRDMAPACNQSKHDKDPILWLTAKFGPRRANAKLKKINAYFALVRERTAL